MKFLRFLDVQMEWELDEIILILHLYLQEEWEGEKSSRMWETNLEELHWQVSLPPFRSHCFWTKKVEFELSLELQLEVQVKLKLVKDEKEIRASDFLSNPCKWKFKLGLGFLFLVELLSAPRIELGFGSKKHPCPSLGFKFFLKSFIAKLLLALRVAQWGL